VVLFGCEYERIAAPESLCESENLLLEIESFKNTPCGDATGEIVATVTGDGVFEYRINDGDFSDSNIFSGLSVGSYTIQAKAVDSNCLSEEIDQTIGNNDGIKLSVIEKNNSACGGSTGSILVGQEDGVEPIEYIINDTEAQASPEFTGLEKGSYTIVARDANGCQAEISSIVINTNISFSNDVKSIIVSNCAVSGCHNGTQSPNFTVDENILQNASRIKSNTGSGSMPPAGRPDLTESQIQDIACWVDGGALDN
jgi:hypothetical protein